MCLTHSEYLEWTGIVWVYLPLILISVIVALVVILTRIPF